MHGDGEQVPCRGMGSRYRAWVWGAGTMQDRPHRDQCLLWNQQQTSGQRHQDGAPLVQATVTVRVRVRVRVGIRVTSTGPVRVRVCITVRVVVTVTVRVRVGVSVRVGARSSF